MGKMNVFMVVSTFFAGIMAGLFFAWTFSVMNGQAKLPDREFILSVQSMNREIQNPVFFLFFFGTPVLLVISVFISYRTYSPTSFILILISTVLYVFGVLLVTIVKNIPLNNMLDNFTIGSAQLEQISALRIKFEKPWNNWNLVRTLCNAFSFLLLLTGMIKK